MKKASGNKKKKAPQRKAAKKAAGISGSNKPTRKTRDMGAVREKISSIVSDAAANITKKLVTKAADGELAHSKYLFEMAGVYPASEAAGPPPEEESLAKTLLQRMGLPTTPVVEDENGEVHELEVPVVKERSEP